MSHWQCDVVFCNASCISHAWGSKSLVAIACMGRARRGVVLLPTCVPATWKLTIGQPGGKNTSCSQPLALRNFEGAALLVSATSSDKAHSGTSPIDGQHNCQHERIAGADCSTARNPSGNLLQYCCSAVSWLGTAMQQNGPQNGPHERLDSERRRESNDNFKVSVAVSGDPWIDGERSNFESACWCYGTVKPCSAWHIVHCQRAQLPEMRTLSDRAYN